MKPFKLPISINKKNGQIYLRVQKKKVPKRIRNNLMTSDAIEVMFGDVK